MMAIYPNPSYITIIVGIIFATIQASNAQIDITSPGESLYDVSLTLTIPTCDTQTYEKLCEVLSPLGGNQCEVMTSPCDTKAKLRVSFSSEKSSQAIDDFLTISPKRYGAMTITSYQISDVNECVQAINKCSRNGYCINAQGTYRCECGYGFTAQLQSLSEPGTYCVARCNARSCRMGAICTEATDEDTPVSCECESGFTGDNCETKVNSFPKWGVIVIGVLASLAAIVGIVLCIYTCYRLFGRKNFDDDRSDMNSIYDYKPRAMPASEYDRFTDIGSVGRNNRGFASTIDEESERGTIRNDGLKFGTRLMSSRLSIPSEQGDPTPVLNPYQRTERHAVDVESQADYYS